MLYSVTHIALIHQYCTKIEMFIGNWPTIQWLGVTPFLQWLVGFFCCRYTCCGADSLFFIYIILWASWQHLQHGSIDNSSFKLLFHVLCITKWQVMGISHSLWQRSRLGSRTDRLQLNYCAFVTGSNVIVYYQNIQFASLYYESQSTKLRDWG